MTDLHEPPPEDRRKHGYEELEKHVEEFEARLLKRVSGFFVKMLIAVALIGLTSTSALLGFGVLIRKESQNTTTIQQQRYDSLIESCNSQNRRHDRAIARAKINLTTPVGTRNAIALIEQLAPFEKDCPAYARSRVKGNI